MQMMHVEASLVRDNTETDTHTHTQTTVTLVHPAHVPRVTYTQPEHNLKINVLIIV